MNCPEAAKYERGELSEAEFESHAAGCPCCLEILRREAEIMSQARALRRPIQAPGLWSRIEQALEEEAAKERARAPLLARFLRPILVAALVLATAGLVLTVGLWKHAPSGFSGILSNNALARVERAEKEYLKSLEELEKQAQSQMVGLDLELNFLYRDRLGAIDAQIARCQEALRSNPANAHIRRYLMAALHDKRETLTEVLNLKAGKPEGA
jgi:hypothetical protein